MDAEVGSDADAVNINSDTVDKFALIMAIILLGSLTLDISNLFVRELCIRM